MKPLDRLAEGDLATEVVGRVTKSLAPISARVRVAGDVTALAHALVPLIGIDVILQTGLRALIAAVLAKGWTPEQLDGVTIYAGPYDGKLYIRPAPAPQSSEDEPSFQMTQSSLGFLLEDVVDGLMAAIQPGPINVLLPEIQAPDIYVDGGAEPIVIRNEIELPAKAKRTRLARARDGSTVIQKEY